MKAPHPAAGSPLTWILAVLLVVLIDAAITRTPVLWAGMKGENTLDVRVVQVAQTYQAVRKIYWPQGHPAARVVLLGDSRLWFAAQDAYVERAIARIAPDLDVEVDDLGIFGALIGDLEALSRHLDRLRPDLVVIAIDGIEMLPTKNGDLGNWPAQVLDVGWADGPLPASGMEERVDRWLRTIWPLYRFRVFAREAIEDRLEPGPSNPPFPDHFASTAEFHAFMHGEKAPAIEAAYRRFRRDPSLDGFIAYLKTKRRGFLRRPDLLAPAEVQLRPGSPGVRILDAMLARLAAERLPTIVLLMPQNPLLEQDVRGRHHRPEFSDRAAALIRAAAGRHGIPVVDGRGWMPAESFLDLVHLIPDVSGFQDPLAREIVRALRS